jgi:hypothetical protein
MGDVLDQYRGLGVEALGIGWHPGQPCAQEAGDVVLFVWLEHIVLEFWEQLPGLCRPWLEVASAPRRGRADVTAAHDRRSQPAS